MFRHLADIRMAQRVLGVVYIGERSTWSRPISARADSKLAPCVARPNLFSGD